MSIKKSHDSFPLFKLLADLHEANVAQLVALTAIIKTQELHVSKTFLLRLNGVIMFYFLDSWSLVSIGTS